MSVDSWWASLPGFDPLSKALWTLQQWLQSIAFNSSHLPPPPRWYHLLAVKGDGEGPAVAPSARPQPWITSRQVVSSPSDVRPHLRLPSVPSVTQRKKDGRVCADQRPAWNKGAVWNFNQHRSHSGPPSQVRVLLRLVSLNLMKCTGECGERGWGNQPAQTSGGCTEHRHSIIWNISAHLSL